MGEKAEKRLIGAVGEEIAARFLKKHGFSIIARNYRKKWGEIDIVAQQKGILRFVEVKTVSRTVSPETSGWGYRPEENVHPRKIQRISRAIMSFLLEKGVSGETKEEIPWQIDVVTVLLDVEGKMAKVGYLENIVV